MNKKINLVCKERLDKYRQISEKALVMAKKNIANKKEQEAKKIIEMVECYLSDSKHFEKQGNYVNAYGALNYAHGWLDAGARAGFYKVKDSRLFTVDD